MNDNPTRHVIVALALTAAIFVIAGDDWNAKIAKIVPVRPVVDKGK